MSYNIDDIYPIFKQCRRIYIVTIKKFHVVTILAECRPMFPILGRYSFCDVVPMLFLLYRINIGWTSCCYTRACNVVPILELRYRHNFAFAIPSVYRNAHAAATMMVRCRPNIGWITSIAQILDESCNYNIASLIIFQYSYNIGWTSHCIIWYCCIVPVLALRCCYNIVIFVCLQHRSNAKLPFLQQYCHAISFRHWFHRANLANVVWILKLRYRIDTNISMFLQHWLGLALQLSRWQCRTYIGSAISPRHRIFNTSTIQNGWFNVNPIDGVSDFESLITMIIN